MATATTGIRVFFALWPSAAERSRLAAWLPELGARYGGRKMHADTLHCTLVFVGHIASDRTGFLRDALQQVTVSPFTLCFDEVRCWEYSGIVYAAPGTVPEQLVALVALIEDSLQTIGVKFDKRRYQPHVTLLRNARCDGKIQSVIEPVCWEISDFSLLQSIQTEGRAGYRVVSRFPRTDART
jgi:2'-5' RNA ligase